MRKLRELCQDTFFRGSMAGIIGGLLKNLVNMILEVFEPIHNTYIILHATVAFNRKPLAFVESLYGFVSDLIFSGLVGLLISLLIQNFKTRHYMLVGFFSGSLLWFVVKAFILAFDIDILQQNLSNIVDLMASWFLSAMVGVVMAFLDRQLGPPIEARTLKS